MESTEFAEGRSRFQLLAGIAVLCFLLHDLVMATLFAGLSPVFSNDYLYSVLFTVRQHSWGLRLFGLICLGLSLFWKDGWRTKAHARLFGILFLIDFVYYVVIEISNFLFAHELPHPELDPIQVAVGAWFFLSMLFLFLSLLMGGKGSRLAFAVFLAAGVTLLIYSRYVTGPEIDAWIEVMKAEAQAMESQSPPGITPTVIGHTVTISGPLTGWGSISLYVLAFIYIFFLKRPESSQADPSPF